MGHGHRPPTPSTLLPPAGDKPAAPPGKAVATAAKFMNKYRQKNGGGAEGGAGALVAAAAGPEPYDPEEAGQVVEIPFMAPPK